MSSSPSKRHALVHGSGRAGFAPVLALTISLVGLASGCGNKDSVSLGATLSGVELTVTEQTLGTQLSGSFQLHLEVGAEADGDAHVELSNFSLVRASDQATLVGTLQVLPQGVTFPVTVGKGQSKTIVLVLDDSALLPASDKANLCAGKVQVVGAVTHDLLGGETKPVRGNAVLPSGC